MEKASTSFWADIKKYEDTLARDPKSYCFAPLSELYRKLGLLDDAIGTAQRGVEVHPEYIGGYMALGRAYFEKGMRQEAKESLEKVAKATPENLLAQKLLSQIFQEQGDMRAAERALQILISFNPEDTESRLVLESLQRSGVELADGDMSPADVTDVLKEGISIGPPDERSETAPGMPDGSGILPFSELPDYQEAEDQSFIFEEWEEAVESEDVEDDSGTAPISTVTLAELYEAQGFSGRALEVYRDLLLHDPDNQDLRERQDALRSRIENEEASPLSVPDQGQVESLPEACPLEMPGVRDLSVRDFGEGAVRGLSYEEEVVETLEQWLDCIRRERECRSREF
ncbi:MAG: tetratricopeptide repeat protein [Deltaproteobacteria bacterium]|nr:tetratricopeptide repeat protein [Deltaproteobacteria bacterium]